MDVFWRERPNMLNISFKSLVNLGVRAALNWKTSGFRESLDPIYMTKL